MAGIINTAARKINTDIAGLTGANAPTQENLPTAPLIDRIVAPSDYGGLGHLFSDLIPMETPSNTLTKPVSAVGPNGGLVPPNLAKGPLPTFLGQSATRLKRLLGL